MSRSRKFLLQCRYAADANGRPLDENLEELGLASRFDPEHAGWIRDLGRTTGRHLAELDREIESVLENWRLERLNTITRLILEQALAEVRYGDTPPPVAIDEAIRLSREFEEEDACSFVNGVLDRLVGSGSGG
jgi:N utilization substance protein B